MISHCPGSMSKERSTSLVTELSLPDNVTSDSQARPQTYTDTFKAKIGSIHI